MKELETQYTREITCPYCGYEFGDSWEINGDQMEWDDDIECGSCEKTFHASRIVTIDYCTSKMEDSL